MQKKLVCFFLPLVTWLSLNGQEEQVSFSDLEIGVRLHTIPMDYHDNAYASIDPSFYYAIVPRYIKGKYFFAQDYKEKAYIINFYFFHAGLWVANNLKNKRGWYYRFGADFFYLHYDYEDKRENYPPFKTITFKRINSMRLIGGIGYKKDWKLLTFSCGLEGIMGITGRGKSGGQALYQSNASLNTPYPFYKGTVEAWAVTPRRVFTGANLYIKTQASVSKRLAVGLEMGNGFTYNWKKGTYTWRDEYYDTAGELYRTREQSSEWDMEGFWWEPLRFSLGVSWKF